MIGKHKAAGGMVITASHNPIEWNGLKCLNADGVAPPPQKAQQIIDRFKNRDFKYAAPSHASTLVCDDSAHDVHLKKVLASVNVRAIRRAKLKVVLDSVNGAGCAAGRMLLERLGCRVIHINGEPTGAFAHAPEPTESNLAQLAKATKRARAAIGFAQDPDADRLAIIDNTGRYIGEEYTLVLSAQQVLEQLAGNPRSAGGRSKGTRFIAVNLSTSRMIDDLASKYLNVRVIRTAVGEANVVNAMQKHGAKAIIGGEGNGGVILPPPRGACWVRDSLIAMALVLNLLAQQRQSLSEIVNGLPQYKMIKHKFDLNSVGGNQAISAAMRRVTARFSDAKISTVDGVRLDFADGWVHLRPSNTEPIVRLIAEAKTDARAWELIDEVAVAARLK
jgi:phosphomannomutase